MAKQYLSRIALLVTDYDEAIVYYTQKLGFNLLEDTPHGPGKRWVVVAPDGAKECAFVLAQAANETQRIAVGNQSGGRVFLFLQTDDFWNDYHQMKAQEVEFIEEPRDEVYGIVVVFRDLYGNLWDFIQPK